MTKICMFKYLCGISLTPCSISKSVGTTVPFTLGALIYIYPVKVHFHYRNSSVCWIFNVSETSVPWIDICYR